MRTATARTAALGAVIAILASQAAVAQKIESVVIPQKKTRDRITPTVRLEPARTSADRVADAEGALHCPGNGFVQHAGPPKRDLTVSGQPWLDKIDSETDGFSGEAMLQLGPQMRIHLPRTMRTPLWTELHKRQGDDATLAATGAGGLNVEFNRYSHDLVVRTPIGRFVASCVVPR